MKFKKTFCFIISIIIIFSSLFLTTSAQASINGMDVVNYALQWKGVPYVWGGTSLETGLDCGAFVCRVYEHFGLNLWNYKTTLTSATVNDGIARVIGYSLDDISLAEPGDLLHFPGHVAIYMGDMKVVHAAGEEVKINSLGTNTYWGGTGKKLDKIVRLNAVNNHTPGVDCKKFATINKDGKKLLGACQSCYTKYDYSKVYTGDVAGLWIAKKNQNINLYSEPYEDATYTSVKSGELEVRGYVNNAYGNKWYVINGDKNKTYYVYENTFKNLYTQDSHYYENDYHRYDSGAVIEAPSTNNNGGNNTGLGNSIIGVVDIPSSWDNLSIRTGPSTNYQIVGSMNDGVRCNVYPSKTQNGWYYVEYNGIYGYASGKQINTNNSSTAATPITPAGITLSTSNIYLDYPNSPTQTITVTATGDLPSRYEFDLDIDGYVNFKWGTWSGNSIDLTLTAHESSNSCTPKIYLKNAETESVLATVQFNVNVSQPVKKQTVNIYFNENRGYDAPAAIKVEENSSANIPSQTPYRSGYKFIGWNTTANASSSKYDVGDIIYVGCENITLYAVWEKSDAYLEISERNVYLDTGEEYSIYVTVCGLEYQFGFLVNCDDCIEYDYGEWDDDTLTQEIVFKAADDKNSTGKAYIKLLDYESDNTINDGDDECRDIQEITIHTNHDKKEDFADRNQTGISVYLNGEKLSFDVQPQIINSRTMVPMRKIFEELGTVVGWNNNTQKAISVKKGDVVSVSIGGQYLTVNGEQKLLDSPPIIISGRTLVPVRAVAESFNCDVDWYDFGASQVVDINMQDTINNMENKGGLLIGYSEFAPFSFYDDYGNLIGFDTELAKYVCDFWGWDCSFVEMPFDMGFTAIKTGQIDCYWNAITKTEERMENATFTNDYVEYTYETDENGEWQTWHESYSVPFRKGDYDTVQLVNIALDEAQKDGTIAYLKSKYGIE